MFLVARLTAGFWLLVLQQVFDCFGNSFGNVRIVHGVDVDAVDAVGQKVGNLVDGIGDADVVHGVGFVAVFGQWPAGI